jgi:hypothetical protein
MASSTVKSFVGSLTNMGYRTIHENFIEYNVIRRPAHRRRRFPGPSSLKASRPKGVIDWTVELGKVESHHATVRCLTPHLATSQHSSPHGTVGILPSLSCRFHREVRVPNGGAKSCSKDRMESWLERSVLFTVSKMHSQYSRSHCDATSLCSSGALL